MRAVLCLCVSCTCPPPPPHTHSMPLQVGDVAEVKAVRKVFSDFKNMKMNGTKSLIGHCLGAAAGVEVRGREGVCTCVCVCVSERGGGVFCACGGVTWHNE